MPERRNRKLNHGELPYQVGKGLTDAQKDSGKHQTSRIGQTWNSVVRASQGNFDHLMSLIRNIVTGVNLLADDVRDIEDALEGNIDITNENVAQLAELDEHNHVHGDLESLAGDHDAEYINEGQAAGGVLGGTYPNPSFAADMATQAELDAHTGDTTDAHDASAISVLDAGGNFTGDDVEEVLAELAASGGGGGGGTQAFAFFIS